MARARSASMRACSSRAEVTLTDMATHAREYALMVAARPNQRKRWAQAMMQSMMLANAGANNAVAGANNAVAGANNAVAGANDVVAGGAGSDVESDEETED